MKDQRVAAETVCDWSEEARSADAAYALVNRAFAEFSCQRPLPKHIQVPISVLEAHADAAPKAEHVLREVGADEADVAAAVERLKRAERPLFILGGGAAKASSPIRSILKKLGAASYSTYAGCGIAGPDDPLHYGAMLEPENSVAELRKADLLVCIGTDLAEVDYYRAELGHEAPAIHVNIDPAVLARAGAKDMTHLADANAWCARLSDMLIEHIPSTAWLPTEVEAARESGRLAMERLYPGIATICDALRAAVPPDTMIYSDMTQIAYTAKVVWDMDRPGHWHHPCGFGTLGYATPAAIGGAVARPGKPTMAMIGDYGFHYTMQELGVAVELGLSLPIVLWDNGKLKEIEDSMVRAQIAPNAVVARNPDFCGLAKAFGAHARAPTSLAALQDEIRVAFEAQGPTLIYVTPNILT